MTEKRVSSVGIKTGFDINHDGQPDAVHIESGDIYSEGRNKKGKKTEDHGSYRSLVPAVGNDEKDSYLVFDAQDPAGPKPGEPHYGIAWLFKMGGVPFFDPTHTPFVARQSVINDGALHTVKAFRVVVSERDDTIAVSEAKAVLDNGKIVGLNELAWADDKGKILRHPMIESMALCLVTSDNGKYAEQKKSASSAEVSIAEFYAHVATTADGKALSKEKVSDILLHDVHFKPLAASLNNSNTFGLRDAVLEGAYYFLQHAKPSQ